MSAARSRRHVHRVMSLALFAVLMPLASGCAAHAVGAYQREHLADPIMSFKSEARRAERRTKALEAREGSTGGNGGEGGGCACK